MKKRFLLLPLLAATATLSHAALSTYSTPGTGKLYTFNDLSKIEGSLVKDAGSNVYELSGNLTIAAGDTLKLDNNATVKITSTGLITINGFGDFVPADTATITILEEGGTPKGVYFHGDAAGMSGVKHVNFYGAQLRYGTATGNALIEDCTFEYTNSKQANGAVAFNVSSDNNVVRNCRFLHCTLSGVLGGSNIQVGLTIENCYFEDCTTANRNYPFINVVVAGERNVVVRNNTIIGSKLRYPGGISVSNLLGNKGTNNVLVEGNYVKDVRYGIYLQGASNSVVRNNTLVDNRWDTDPMTGGSGINLTSSGVSSYAYLEGNHVEGSLWGLTIIGKFEVNAGKTDDKSASDYNPGNNVFLNNGNNGVAGTEGSSYDPSKPYDLYNNTALTQYAQGNTWSVTEQTAENIAKVIYDKADDSSLGEVIYMPREATGVEQVAVSDSDATARYYNLQGVEVSGASLTPGVYVKRSAGVASKVFVR